MDIIQLNETNIHDQHICCAFSDKKCTAGYQSKKDWLKTEFKNGYTFRKLNERGKVFIEYVPIEYSWLPLEGQNFMVINCFWVSGKFKGQGYGKRLLQECIADAKKQGMEGVIAISSDKKRPFMSDPTFFKRQGLAIIDKAPPFFKLYGLRFKPDSPYPVFKPSAKQGSCPNKEGITAYYSNTCPFTDYWINQHLSQYALEKGISLKIIHLQHQKDGHQMPIPWIISSIFYKGELVTLEMKADRHLDKII